MRTVVVFSILLFCFNAAECQFSFDSIHLNLRVDAKKVQVFERVGNEEKILRLYLYKDKRIIKSSTFEDGALCASTDFSYNNYGQLIKEEWYSDCATDMTEHQGSTIYQYDNSDRLSSEHYARSKGGPVDLIVKYVYVNDTVIEIRNDLTSGNKDTTLRISRIDDRGRIYEKEFSHFGSKNIFIDKYYYDASGYLFKTSLIDDDFDQPAEISYIERMAGRIEEKVFHFSTSGKDSVHTRTETILYDDDMNKKLETITTFRYVPYVDFFRIETPFIERTYFDKNGICKVEQLEAGKIVRTLLIKYQY